MQYLLIDNDETFISMVRTIGQTTANAVLAENGIQRTPNVGAAWKTKCDQIIEETPKDVTPQRKSALLNGLTLSEDVFEKACLLDEDEWKVFSATQAFTDALRIPETTQLTSSIKVLGNAPLDDSTNTPVDSATYREVMRQLKDDGNIDPAVFNTVNASPAFVPSGSSQIETSAPQYSFDLPWGKIQMYSTVLGELMDFPAYPDQIEQTRNANYASMPDTIYQYEPWITYQDSGPREQPLSFHLHRDMWTGNHLDGRANQLIRFCEANTFPDYNGSAIITPFIRLYVDGSLFISGVIKNTSTTWSGPLGLDNWYLEFTLSLSIQEISESELNTHSVYAKKLKEG